MNVSLQVNQPVRSLLVTLLLVMGGFMLIGPAIGLAVASAFYPGDLWKDIADPATAGHPMFDALMVIQGIAALLGLILLPVLHLIVAERHQLPDYFRGPAGLEVLLATLLAGICLQIVLSPVVEWNMQVRLPDFMKEFEAWARHQENIRLELTRLLTTFQSNIDFIVALLVIGVLPGVGEELVFRGIIQNRILQATGNIHLAVWISAFLFSAIHLQFYGLVPRMLLGAFFGYLYAGSGNLLVPVFAHFAHNAITLLMIYLYQLDISSINPEDNTAAPLYAVLISGIMFIGLLYYLRRLFRLAHR
jgi:membrane protease YdiL (CAAX protease family)